MVKYATAGSRTLYQLHSIFNLKKCSVLEHTCPQKASTLPLVHQVKDYKSDKRNIACD
jgi:hypothetical protein